MTRIQLLINPKDWVCLTEDKSVFYKYCMAMKIPSPRLYGIFLLLRQYKRRHQAAYVAFGCRKKELIR